MDVGQQRKSSVNTNLINANADPRLLRGSRGNALMQSPISTDGSAYQDAASNRTTPQPQQPGPTAVMTAVSGPSDDESAAFKKELLESLAALTTHVTSDASLRSSYDVAKRGLERATLEHENMKSSFGKFPAIRERTSNDKEKAAVKLAELDKQLKMNERSQSKLAVPLCDAIWNLFTKAQANSRPEPQPDAVSRKDYEDLHDRFQKQQDLLDQHQDRLDEQSSLIKELKNDVKMASELSTQARNQALTTHGEATALKNKIVKFESFEQSQQTDKRMLTDLVTTVSNHKGDVEQLKSDVARNRSDQDAARDDTLTRLKSATSSAQDLGRVERQLVTIKEDVGKIWKQVLETGKPTVVERLENFDQHINNLWTKAGSSESSGKALEKQINSAREILDHLQQELKKVKEDGKELARIKLVEEHIERLAQDLSKVRGDAEFKAASNAAENAPAPPAATSAQTNAPNNFDFDAFKNEVVEDAVEQIEKVAEEVDNHGAHIEGLQGDFKKVTERLNTLESGHENETRKRQSLDEANKTTNAKCDMIQSAVDTFRTRADTLQTDIDALSATIRALQDRPSQASSSTNGTAAQQFRPLSVQPPQAPTPRASVSGPAPTNGFHLPNGTAALQQPVNGNPGGPYNNEVTVTLNQIQSIWASIYNLRQRYDNLTTEDVVKAMADQFSKMYPAPKDFQATVNLLQNVDKILNAKLTSLETKLGSLDTKVGTFAQNSALLRHELKNNASENNANVNGRMQALQAEVAAARDATKALRTEVKGTIDDATRAFDSAVEMQTNAITVIKKEVNALADIAFGKKEEEAGAGGMSHTT